MILQSPDIVLSGVSGAMLSFAAAHDLVVGSDAAELLVREAGTNELLHVFTPFVAPGTRDWSSFGPFALTEADDKTIYLQFRYQGTDNTYLGLYIDDVTVTR